MGAHKAVRGTFPHCGIVSVHATCIPCAGPEPAPTWQKRLLFARAEGSYVHAWDVTPGFALGPNLNDKSQVRGLIEAGIIF